MMWLALAVLGCSVLVGMTRTVSGRAQLQNAADVVALALVTRGVPSAVVLASELNVKIDQVTRDGAEVTVVVRRSNGWATATATGR